jgi:hypothetical protein
LAIPKQVGYVLETTFNDGATVSNYIQDKKAFGLFVLVRGNFTNLSERDEKQEDFFNPQ